MNQVLIQVSNHHDLNLLVSLAHRINAEVLSVRSDVQTSVPKDRTYWLKKASKDPLFMADVVEVSDDFKYIDEISHE